jgi:predicted alpha/beta-fold hydrolase
VPGFSLGANIMTKYLGEEGDKTPICAAVSVSNPIDLYQGSAALEESVVNYHVYNKTFTKNLLRYVKRYERSVTNNNF